MTVQYVIGDATDPISNDTVRIICHVCNDMGGWGRGFVLALSKKWPEPERDYRRWANRESTGTKQQFELGAVDFVAVSTGDVNYVAWVANMIAQHGVGPDELGNAPIRYAALDECLRKVAKEARHWEGQGLSVSIHMPRIGCGLAGGNWAIVESGIQACLAGLSVYVYDLYQGP